MKRISSDSRLNGSGVMITHSVLPYERTFCSECGKPWGWTTQDSSQFIAAAEVVVYCDVCFEKLNAQAGTPLVPIPSEELKQLGLFEDFV